MNSFGNIFKLTSFGESHGKAVGGVIDGCPAGLFLDVDYVQTELNRRRPGQSSITTPRDEDDEVVFLSGLFEGWTTGMPIAFIVKNKNQESSDYNNLKNVFRPSHADYTYFQKYGIRDHRGGGRSSARETIARVVAGAVAKQMLESLGVTITAYTSSVGTISLESGYEAYDHSEIENNIVRCPDPEKATQMIEFIQQLRAEGDSIGGVISCVIKNTPVGLGEPVFGKLQAALSSAMFSINAVKGFDYGSGFDVSMRGSQANDEFIFNEGKNTTSSNNSGGIQGGISNGEDIYFRVAFKPVSTILMPQRTINDEGEEVDFKASGRHDPCVLPRAVPIVEAMAAITIFDFYLMAKSRNGLFSEMVD